MKMLKTLAALALVLASTSARAGFYEDYMTDPADGQLDVSRFLSEVPMGFLPIPSVITEPAVGYGLAMGALFFHESAEQRKQRTGQALLPENISMLGGGGTENGTWAGALGHFGFWRNDTLRYKGFLLYGSINLDFYSLPGVGELPRPVKLNLEGPVVLQELKYRLPDTAVFLGVRQLYRHEETGFAHKPNLSRFPDVAVDFFNEHFDTSNTTSGLGAVVEFDSRDNPFNPQRGYYYSGNYMWFGDYIGSDYRYDTYHLSGLNYWQPGDRFNLGLRLQYDGVSVDDGERLPVYVPPDIDLRGIPSSRYQGNAVAVSEVQLDYRINDRWRVGVFTGVGRAADSFGKLDNAANESAYGTGFRYLIARRYGFVMGVDVARGPEETAVYIKAGSTW